VLFFYFVPDTSRDFTYHILCVDHKQRRTFEEGLRKGQIDLLNDGWCRLIRMRSENEIWNRNGVEQNLFTRYKNNTRCTIRCVVLFSTRRVQMSKYRK
jgi:hypothetical protein